MSYLFDGVSGAAFCRVAPGTHPPSLTLWKLGDTDTSRHLDPYRTQEDPRIYCLRERPLASITELNLTLSHTFHPPPNS